MAVDPHPEGCLKSAESLLFAKDFSAYTDVLIFVGPSAQDPKTMGA